MADRAARSARGDRTKREEDQRDPLDQYRERPGRAGGLLATGGGKRQSAERESDQDGVIVPAAGEVDREEGVPAADEPATSATPSEISVNAGP